MPAAVAGAETVGALESGRVNLFLKHRFHIIGHALHNLAAHAVHGIGLEHIVTALDSIGPLEITASHGCHEYGIFLCSAQLAADYLACIKRYGTFLPYQCEFIGLKVNRSVHNHILELRAQELI